MPATVAPRVANASDSWLEHFRANANSLVTIPWERGAEISDAERQAIGGSVQEFQLGESSEGRHLIGCAAVFGRHSDDESFLPSIRLFIAEEQRHARDLGRFMDLAGISRKHYAWVDQVFRRLRQFGGLEVSVSVLVTAEIIAKVYYAALRDATRSVVLRTLCGQILRDEHEHVRFQCRNLALLRRDRREAFLRLTVCAQRFLFWGACLVVWKGHRSALRAGGYSFRRFWRDAWREMDEATSLMGPEGSPEMPGVE